MSDTRYYENLCFRLKLQGLSNDEISKETGLSAGQVAKRLNDYSKRNPMLSKKTTEALPTGFNTVNGVLPNKLNLGTESLEDTLTKEDDFFTLPDGRDESLYLYKDADRQREKVAKYIEDKYKGQPVKMLYLSDLHIPFTIYDLVKHIIEEHADADVLVINGDFLDLFNVSTFAKDKSVALHRELEEGREFLEVVSKIFKDVVITEGNHERRLRNYIKHVVPVDMHFLFPQDCLQVVQNGSVFDKEPLENVHVVGSWWVKLFDTIIAHPDNFNAGPLKTVINTSEHFTMVKGVPHRACVIGHTHQAGKFIDRNRMVMETGCLQHDVDYKHGSRFIKTTWTKAHALLYFNADGEVLFNESQVVTY
jgi:transcriptional regulator with XRE-family HTH domain